MDHYDAADNLEITFSYMGYPVTVTGNSAVTIHE
ncbi:hypothetical protein [Natrinema versiforme]